MRKYFLLFLISLFGIIIITTNVIQANPENVIERPLMRFPDIYEDNIVFVYGEDIWKFSPHEEVATRLTIHDGEERFPKFSPNGELIAFTGEYDGNPDIYIMNPYGGNITRLTYHPGYDEVVGWHPQKNKIIFRSNRESASRYNQLFMIDPDGRNLEKLILHEAVAGSFSADGSMIAYNRVAREHRTWKRYKGGLAQDIYLFDFNTKKDKKITDFKGTDRIPMWIGKRIYFTSDKDGVLNIYSFDTESKQITQHTTHKEYDVRRPSKGITKIIYEYGGTLRTFDTETETSEQIDVKIRSDAPEKRPYIKNVKNFVTNFDCSPSGNRAIVVARGEVFTVPRKNGPTRNITNDSGARDRGAVWSPDGQKIAYISDKSGEYEIYITDSKGLNKPTKLTTHTRGYRQNLKWSPDGQKIAFADQTLSLYYIDMETKKITTVDKAEYENVDIDLEDKPIYDFNWSPDSRYLTYSKMDKNLVTKVYVYSLKNKTIHCISSGLFNDFHPVFTKDGEHLLFVSNRSFNPTFSDMAWEMVYKDIATICSVTLSKDGSSLFPPESDEAGLAENEVKKGDDDNQVLIDFEGIENRIEMFPLPKGNYRELKVNEDFVFYLNSEEGDYNRFKYRDLGPRNLYAFSLKDRKQQLVIKGIDDYKLSSNGTHIAYKKGNKIGIIKSSDRDSKGHELDFSDLHMRIVPQKEWRQIFNEAWRMERDFYYEPEMHGVDWEAMKEKYGKLLAYASCRQDVGYLIGEMIGELNTSHTYVYGGDVKREAERLNIGMLGTDWEVDKNNKLYKFKKIYKVADWSRKVIPPLAKPGIKIKEGDYLLKVNGTKVSTDENIYSCFQGLAGDLVSITVNDNPTMEGANEYLVTPIRSERTLRYQDWVKNNRLKVDKASDGTIGYLHLPDTYMGSCIEFPKYFFSQLNKKALIIDGRYNGGGLDPDIFLRRLDKKVRTYWTRRYSHDQIGPPTAMRAHYALLTNKQAGSGGDMLPYEFRHRKMGPIIGTRTWGGLVGVSMFIQLIDGGGLTAPDYRVYSEKGEWVVENIGIEPDINIDLDPAEMSKGYDAQLMKAVELLKKKLEQEKIEWPQHEEYPRDKKRKNNK
ncbi:MAG: S41 family peptidase [Candidatus Aminicenantaceae bacterium]